LEKTPVTGAKLLARGNCFAQEFRLKRKALLRFVLVREHA